MGRVRTAAANYPFRGLLNPESCVIVCGEFAFREKAPHTVSGPCFSYFLTKGSVLPMAKTMSLKATIIRAGAILAAAAAAALVFNWLSPSGIPLEGRPESAGGALSAMQAGKTGGPDTEIGSVAEALAAFERGEAVFVDARPASAFAEGHIPGAVSLPVREFDDRIEAFWKQTPTDKRIVTYCSGRTCQDSHRLARLLEQVGYKRVRIFVDGYSGWVSAGHPVSTGDPQNGRGQTP